MGEENELHVDNHLLIGRDKEHEISFDQIEKKRGEGGVETQNQEKSE